MKQKIVLVFSAYFVLFMIGLISCGELGECGGPYPNKFKVIGLDWANYKASYSSTSDTRLTLSLIENNTVEYEQYSIFISPKKEYYYAQISNRWKFGFMQTAYACSPPIPETDEKIDGLIISSTKDYNATHPSGSDLSDLFDIIVLDDVKGIYFEKYDLQTYLSTNPYVPSEMALILREPPDLTSDFEFLVKYYQNGIDGNDYFEFVTNKIVIF